MLTILNNYSNGYVAIPVVIACKRRGLFDKLSETEALPFSSLVNLLGANSGHLRTALHMLESLGWVCRNSDDEYSLMKEASIRSMIPNEIMSLTDFPIKKYLKKNQRKYSLADWIRLSTHGWSIEQEMYREYLDGMIAIPLLLTLKQLGHFPTQMSTPQPVLFPGISRSARKEILDFFLYKGWVAQEKEGVLFTDAGRFIVDRIFITATILSYKPMLKNIEMVIFGDCQEVFKRDKNNHELHIDRKLNVIGSGFQHEKYFSDLEEIIVSLFDRKPFQEQPKYIADMGCGDGSLLKKIHEIICKKSLRGQVLDQYPLTLIGLDYNEKALEATTATLSGLKHIVIKGNIGDPAECISNLRKLGIDDPENILHIRSFLDHDRPYIPPINHDEARMRNIIPTQAVHTDETGNAIQASDVMQSLVEHMKRWSSVINKHGIILLEVHCLEPTTVNTFIDKCESLHFDAYHRFSQQLLVEADKFVDAAAESGLFPHSAYFRKYPKTMPFSRITLNYFKPKGFSVRYAQEKDLEFLDSLEDQCWGMELRASSETLLNRIRQYPQGQCVLIIEGEVVGVAYSMRTNDKTGVLDADLNAKEAPFDPQGSVIQLLGVNIRPDLQDRKLGDQLLEFMLQRINLIESIRIVSGVTRCKDYNQYSHMSIQDYIQHRNDKGMLVDTTLRFHEMHGAKIIRAVANYRPQDAKSGGYGVLIEYDIIRRQRIDNFQEVREPVKLEGSPQLRAKTTAIKAFVTKTICFILGEQEGHGFDLERPLMEMGLDSADLLELNEQLSTTFQMKLGTTFFFKYNTPQKIITYLQETTDAQSQAETDYDIGVMDMENGKDENKSSFHHEVAIIGVSLSLPGGVNTLEQLAELLYSGKDAVTELPPDRWEWPGCIKSNGEYPGIDKGGFITGIDQFDSQFFRISPTEAEVMDPQQRKLLELSWICLEDAGYAADKVKGTKTAVFVGASGSDYGKLMQGENRNVEAKYGVGTSMAALANRISYFYDWHGPSQVIDTACSSSLVAVHEAVRALRSGECEQALVGGVNIMCHPANSLAYYKSGMLSKEGKCKTFDKDADGYVRGEGVIMILLKPAVKAIEDGDAILAIIKGTATNHGGQAGGLTAPNPVKQGLLIKDALRAASVDPRTVGYVEAHGTGTPLGDPIEIAGLVEGFTGGTTDLFSDSAPSCGLGSIKTNIGHLEAAAGLAGLLKVILSLKTGVLPASLHFRELNPNCLLDKTPFYIVKQNQPWTAVGEGQPRRAGVSSFGSGGANAHVILEEISDALQRDEAPSSRLAYYPICLNAKTEQALNQKKREMLDWLVNGGARHPLEVLSTTLLFGRDHFKFRSAFAVKSMEHLKHLLEEELGPDQSNYAGNDNVLAVTRAGVNQEERGASLISQLREEQSAEAYRCKLEALLGLYMEGYDPNWNGLYPKSRKIRLELPAYPFAKTRFWLDGRIGDEPSVNQESSIRSTVEVLHPMLHRNVSDLFSQRYVTEFAQEEPIVKDHLVHGKSVLPGVVYLEMARAAVECAAGALITEQKMIRMKNISWLQPLYVTSKPINIYTRLFIQGENTLSFEISKEGIEEGEAQPIIYCQGDIMLLDRVAQTKGNVISAQEQYAVSTLSTKECYSCFQTMGLHYGATFQVIDSVQVGDGFAAAKLSLHGERAGDPYVLHPSMMDAALQASLLLWRGGSNRPFVPYLLEQLDIWGGSGSVMRALVYAGGSPNLLDTEHTKQVDIDLCAEDGTVCIQFKGLLMKQFERNKESVPTRTTATRLRTNTDANPLVLVESKANDNSMDDLLKEKSIVWLKRLVADTLNMRMEDIHAQEPLEQYGIDSILIIQMMNALRNGIENISRTVFFEYQTIEAIVDHLISTRRPNLLKLFDLDEKADVIKESGKYEDTLSATLSQSFFREGSRFLSASPQRDAATKKQNGIMDVAVVGLAGRYPGAKNVQEFWALLESGGNAISEIPRERWNWEAFYHDEKGKTGSMYTKWGGFIEGVDAFDPLFFHISPADAEKMDPQERLFLEVAYESMEDAGYCPSALSASGKIGVFVGVMNANYPTGAEFWSIANRVSYAFNFQGPSISVDTACSSSLTAIHLALESLYSGTSDCVIAGGVNLILHPDHYLKLSSATMLSSSNQCKAFGNEADGFVDGEGVGAVVLKPLHQAVVDGDHIYGVIKGSMINAGGKTNGYTVPNPNAQAEVVHGALQRAGIHPRMISYVEAHGTGTVLGDPIEVSGLKLAFERQTGDTQFCALGSVKSNIGHLESAAGIAGLTKVLLQLSKQQLVPSLHSSTLNPYIDFTQTPFVVQQRLGVWTRPVLEENGRMIEYPRTAGLSSFGAGGANAHLIIQEYVQGSGDIQSTKITNDHPVMILLSAKTEPQLKEQARRLRQALKHSDYTDHDLPAIAYTYQVGREAMTERLGLLAASLGELREKLDTFTDGREGQFVFYRGSVKPKTDIWAILDKDQDWEDMIAKWMAGRKYGNVLELWTRGITINWSSLYGSRSPRRISLPTYPFAKEKFWLQPSVKGTDVIHPLLHWNTSDFNAQRFTTSVFSLEVGCIGSALSEVKVIPAASTLEMIRAGIEHSLGTDLAEEQRIVIKQATWDMNAAVSRNQSSRVNLDLIPETDGGIVFRLAGDNEGNAPCEFTSGIAEVAEVSSPPPINLTELIEQFPSQQQPSSAECLETLTDNEAGGENSFYGNLYMAEEGDSLLMELIDPAPEADAYSALVLRPALLQAAFQAIALLRNDNCTWFMARHLEEMIVYRRFSSCMWVFIRAGIAPDEYHFDFIHESGEICATIKGLSFERFNQGDEASSTHVEESVSSDSAFSLVWDQVHLDKISYPIPSSETMAVIGGTQEMRLSILKERPHANLLDVPLTATTAEMSRIIGDLGDIQHVVWIAPCSSEAAIIEESVIAEQERGVISLFRLIKAFISKGYESKSLQWTLITIQVQQVYPGELIRPVHASLFGLIGSMAKEYANWGIRLLDLEEGSRPPIDEILDLPADPFGQGWSYRNMRWHRRRLVQVQIEPEQPEGSAYKYGGVYVVIGGAGGIGNVWSEYMIRRYQAQIVWIGRREKDDQIERMQQELGKLGPAPYYISADGTDYDSLMQAFDIIKSLFNRVDGVVHSAIVLQDMSLANMDETRFRSGLEAKVNVSVRLAQVFGKEKLDFILFFSSVNSFLMSPGQSNYTSGCTFKDVYALALSEQLDCTVKVVNWGYWGTAGIVADQSYRERLAQIGMRSVDPEAAMSFLEQLLNGPINQMAYLNLTKSVAGIEINSGERISIAPELTDSMKRQLRQREPKSYKEASCEIEVESSRDRGADLEEIKQMLIRELAAYLRISTSDVYPELEWQEHGLDRFAIYDFVSSFSTKYGFDLSASLFIEHGSLERLALFIWKGRLLPGAFVV